MPRINASALVRRAMQREGGKKQVDVAQAMELFGAICFEMTDWLMSSAPRRAYREERCYHDLNEMIYRLARAHARRRKIKVEW